MTYLQQVLDGVCQVILWLQKTQDLIIIITDTSTPTMELIQTQLYPVHNFTPFFSKIHFNILHPSDIWSLSLRVLSQNSLWKLHCLSISSPLGPEVSDELNNSMGQNLSSEAYSSSASQEIPHIFVETEGSLLWMQKPIICLYPKPD